MDFKHITHVGFNPDTGFSQFNMDEKLEGFFNMVSHSYYLISHFYLLLLTVAFLSPHHGFISFLSHFHGPISFLSHICGPVSFSVSLPWPNLLSVSSPWPTMSLFCLLVMAHCFLYASPLSPIVPSLLSFSSKRLIGFAYGILFFCFL